MVGNQAAQTTRQKKTPPEGGVLGVEAGFIQARNLSSSKKTLRKETVFHKGVLPRFGASLLSRGMWHIFAIVFAVCMPAIVSAAESHGLAMHGKPALEKDFSHLPYVNPNAPKGGRLTQASTGGFTGLNPYVLKSGAPWPVRSLTVESLMARSYDEPFTLYGLLAESVETPEDRSWVAFTLREEAAFSDGSPVTVEDVIWSFQTLGTEGHPRYRKAWEAVAGIKSTGPRTVRIDLSVENRELPLILGLRPILKKEQFVGKDFASTGGEQVIGSGPYVVSDYEFSRQITFKRNPDYWGKDLPVNKGLHNFDEIRFDFYRNDESMWEAVKTGKVSIYLDSDAARWADGYDFEAVTSGALQRAEVQHRRPSGMEGFVFNTRREMFADRRVRQALALTFDWEWINDRLFRGAYTRIDSYFGGSDLGFDGSASPIERAILAPFADTLPTDTLDKGWLPPSSDGSGRDRKNLRKAGRLLKEAGWTVQDGIRRNAEGKELRFEILVAGDRNQQLASLWRESLERLGIIADVRSVDDAQYTQRRNEYDFDMIVYRWGMSLSPGNEQRFYFASTGRDLPGTRNYMGVADPAVDAAIDALLAATEKEDFQAGVRALDRVLMSGIYVIPFGVLPGERIVWTQGVEGPDASILYGWWGWWGGPARWWATP